MRSNHTIVINYRGIDLEVSGSYYAGCPAKMYLRNGDPGYPEEPAIFDINLISYKGEDITDFFNGLCSERRVLNKTYYDDCYMEIEDLCIDKVKEDERDGPY